LFKPMTVRPFVDTSDVVVEAHPAMIIVVSPDANVEMPILGEGFAKGRHG